MSKKARERFAGRNVNIFYADNTLCFMPDSEGYASRSSSIGARPKEGYPTGKFYYIEDYKGGMIYSSNKREL
jgi:hypothetical protein